MKRKKRCECGHRLQIEMTLTNQCECGAEYNWRGERLAPREEWIEEYEYGF